MCPAASQGVSRSPPETRATARAQLSTRWSELSDPTGMPPACHLMVMFLGRAKDLSAPEHPGGTAALDRWLSPSATHACRVVGAAQLQQDMPPWLWRVWRVWRAFQHMAGVAGGCGGCGVHSYILTYILTYPENAWPVSELVEAEAVLVTRHQKILTMIMLLPQVSQLENLSIGTS